MRQWKAKAISIAAAALTAGTASGSIPVCAEDQVIDVQRGDLNEDGKVTVEDAQLALLEYAEQVAEKPGFLTDGQFLAADVNKDGYVNVADAQTMLNYYCQTGLIGEEKSWAAFFSPEYSGMEVPDTGDKLTICAWENYADISDMAWHFMNMHPEFNGLVEFKSIGTWEDDGNVEKFEKYLADGNDMDLFVVPNQSLNKFFDQSSHILPVSKLGFKDSDFDCCYPAAVETGLDKDNVLRALAWEMEPGGYVYRSDLAEAYFGVKTPDEMQELVKDWATFLKTAEKLSELTKGSGKMVASYYDFWDMLPSMRKTPWLDAQNMLQLGQEEKVFIESFRSLVVKKYCTDLMSWEPNLEESNWTKLFRNSGTTQETHALGTFMNFMDVSKQCDLSEIETDPEGKHYYCYGKFNITVGPAAWTDIQSFDSCYIIPDTADNGSLARQFLESFITDEANAADFIERTHTFSCNRKANQLIGQSGYKNPLLGGQSEYSVFDKAASQATVKYARSQFDLTLNTRFWLCLIDNTSFNYSPDSLLKQLDLNCCDLPQIKHITDIEN